jgi:insulysin
LSHIKEIGTHLFAYIGMLQKTAVQEWIFQEAKKLRALQFKFGEDSTPFNLCPNIALSLLRHPPSEALSGDVLLYDYDPEAIASVIKLLTLDTVRVTHQAKCLAERCTEKDTSYESPIQFLPLEKEWLEAWAAAASPGDGSPEAAIAAAAKLGLHLPKPNPFIPEDLSVRDLPAEKVELPQSLPSSAPRIAKIFHRQDDVFRQPKDQIVFRIYSPFITENVENFTKVDLWCRAVDEALSEFTYDASIAEVTYSLRCGAGAIQLVFGGFNDKLSVLMKAVTEKIVSMTEVPENIWGIVSDAYADGTKNEAFRSPPYAQCGMRWSELVVRGSSFPAYLRLETFEKLKREDLSGVAAEILKSCTVEALMIGNASPADAQGLAAELAKGLGLKEGPATLSERAEARLPEGTTVWDLESTDGDDPNHAVYSVIQIPETLESDFLLRLLDKVLSAKFFESLRTQQQLGYVVAMQVSPGSKMLNWVQVIQTEFDPDYARSRIDAFFVEHWAYIQEKLTEEEFQTCRAGLLSELNTKPKNLGDELGRYLRHFNDRTYNYARRKKAIEFVEKTATLDMLRTFAKDVVQTAPRICLQVRKKLEKADKDLPEGAKIPEDPADLRKWTGHLETVRKFKETATWVPVFSTS